MESTEEHKNNNLFKYLMVGFFAFFVGTSLFLIMNRQKEQPVQDNANQEAVNTIKQDSLTIPSAQEQESSEEYNLTLKTDAVQVKQGTIINVDLYADSKLKNVVGYDIILKYDPLAFDYLKVEPILPDFRIYNYRKDNYLTLTATRDLQSSPAPFSNVKLASLLFEAKKSGNYTFSVEPAFEQSKTDFITDNTEVLSPGLSTLTVDVK